MEPKMLALLIMGIPEQVSLISWNPHAMLHSKGTLVSIIYIYTRILATKCKFNRDSPAGVCVLVTA